MRIRDLKPEDIPVLRRLHQARGYDYPFPDLTAPEFVAVRVLVLEDDQPVEVVAARKTVECYCWLDPAWRNPRWRLDGLMLLHEDMRQQLEKQGFTDAHAWPPPDIERAFGKRLRRIFGWVKSDWASYSRKVKP